MRINISHLTAKLTYVIVILIRSFPIFHIKIVRCLARIITGIAVDVTSVVIIMLCLFCMIATGGALFPVMCVIADILPVYIMRLNLVVSTAVFYCAEVCVTVRFLVSPVFKVKLVCAKGCAGEIFVIGSCIVARTCGATRAVEPIDVCHLAVCSFGFVMRSGFDLFAVIVTKSRNNNRCGIGNFLNAKFVNVHLAAAGGADVVFDITCVCTSSSPCCNANDGVALCCLVNVITFCASAGGIFGSCISLRMGCRIDIFLTSLNCAAICVIILVYRR